jgi:hypothetical protein
VQDALSAAQQAFPGVVEDRAELSKVATNLGGGKVLFWNLLDDLATRTKTTVRVLPTEGKIQLLPGANTLPVSVSGPFRLVLRHVAASLDLETRTTTSRATLEVVWEPTLHPFYLETRPQGLTLVTESGQKTAGMADGSTPVPVDGRLGLTFDIRLPPSPRTEKSIRSIEGKLNAVVPTRMVTVALTTLARMEAANAGGPELDFPANGPAGRVKRIERTRDRWTIRVVLPTPPGDAVFESYQSWVIQNEMTLRANDGKVWKSDSYLLEGNQPTASVVSYHFLVRDCPGPVDPATWRIQYTTPAGLVRMTVPFRFTGVPLP